MALTEPRTAIVGAGLMGRWHAEAAVRAGARVVAFVDRDAARAGALAARYRGCQAAADIETVLATVDVVHVCTPTPSHASISRDVLRAGRHLLLEKPVTATAEETAALLDESVARGLLLCPTHQFVYQRGVQWALRRLDSIGALRHVEFIMCSAGSAGRPDLDDAIADEVLPHPLSLLQRILRSPIAGLDWVVRRPLPGEIRASAGAGGAGISVIISMSGRPTVNAALLIGTHATLEIDLFHGYAVRHGGRVSRVRKAAQPLARSLAVGLTAGINLIGRGWRAEPAYPGLWELVEQFYRAARDGTPSPISPAETLDVARGVERLRLAGPVPSV